MLHVSCCTFVRLLFVIALQRSVHLALTQVHRGRGKEAYPLSLSCPLLLTCLIPNRESVAAGQSSPLVVVNRHALRPHIARYRETISAIPPYCWDRYDWTTGGPCKGNEWRKFCDVPRAYPLRPRVFACLNRSGSKWGF